MAVRYDNLIVSPGNNSAGVRVNQLIANGTVVTAALTFYDLAPHLNHSQFKVFMGLVYVTAIGAGDTWVFNLDTGFRVNQTTASINPNQIVAATVTAPGNYVVGLNLYSGNQAFVGDFVRLEVRRTVSGGGPTITLGADAIMYS